MRLLCAAVAALALCLAAGEDIAARLPRAADQDHRRLSARRRARHHLARLLGDKFTETWGKPVVVENVAGAGGNIAVERVAKAAPDGYTLAMGGNAALVINPNLYDKLNYDPVKDFACITQVFIVPNILVVRTDVPATDHRRS